jgi:hypothetical protein
VALGRFYHEQSEATRAGRVGGGWAPEDTIAEVGKVVRDGRVVEGVDGGCNRVEAAVDDDEITRGRREECGVVRGPPREPVLDHAA